MSSLPFWNFESLAGKLRWDETSKKPRQLKSEGKNEWKKFAFACLEV